MRTAAALALGLALAAAPAAAQEIAAARYADPTTAYPHGVLGDDEEWGTLVVDVRRTRGKEGGLFSGHVTLTYEIAALQDMVFEDTAPRLWDVTGDGSPEVVVVASHQQYGAQLVVIGLDAEADLAYLAATPLIGTRFRWLAPVAAADLDGDGHVEVAFVDRPHLAKTLRVWRYADGDFREIATLGGVTNHQIGDPAIRGGLRDCGQGPELILADADWTRAVSVRLTATGITGTLLGPIATRRDLDAARACP